MINEIPDIHILELRVHEETSKWMTNKDHWNLQKDRNDIAVFK